MNNVKNRFDDTIERCNYVNKFKIENKEKAMMIQPVSLMDKGYGEFLAEHHKERGYLDARELSSLRRIKDIEELFGVKAVRRGFLCEGGVDCNVIENGEIWWPRISKEPNYAGWLNDPMRCEGDEIVAISERNVLREEENRNALQSNCGKDRSRIVFGVVKGDECRVGYCYRFLGVFKLDIEESRKKNACIWNRVSSRLELKK